ncbi:MAG: isoprenylcysteine carboxylmethyltransferase family protein [Chloroflexota bacterium]
MSPDERETIWTRGGAWVIAQFPLGGLAFLAAWIGPKLPEWTQGAARIIGAVLLAGGGLLFVAGVARLGRNLTPFPKPRADGELVQTGVYAVVRHPLYGGGVIAMLGWALLNGRWAGLVAAILLGIFFDAKATREEHWLAARYPAYPAYRKRVRKLIPLIW